MPDELQRALLVEPKDFDVFDQNSQHWPPVNGNAAERRFRLLNFDAIRLSDDAEYLVKGIIPQEGLVVFWGPPKSGKSFLVTEMMLRAGLGETYRGHRTIKGPVIYIAGEGQKGFKKRIEAFRKYCLSDDQVSPEFHLIEQRLDLVGDHEALIGDINAQIRNTKPTAVVLDTLNRTIRGSESSDLDMTAYVEAADKVREAFNCAVIIIHHSGVEGSRPRGHTSLTGAVDCQIAVSKTNEGLVKAVVELAKDMDEGATWYSKLEVVEVGHDVEGDPIETCIVLPAESGTKPSSGIKLTANQQTMLIILEEAGPGGLAVEDWNARAREIGLATKRKQDLFDLRTALKKKGFVHTSGDRWYVSNRGNGVR